MTQISALQRFVEGNADLERLEATLREFDAFQFLGVSRSEETHSDILAWLLDPQGNHSARDFFLTAFLDETGAATEEQIRTVDWSATTVRREWHNVVDGETGFLDILVLNSDAKFACAIENKVLSGEHTEQLTRYRKAIDRQYGGFHRSHLFVTRHGGLPEQSEDHQFWKPVSYETILRLVEKTREHVDPGNEAVTAFLQQYTTTLRRRIVPDTEIKRMATRIYLQHTEAIDLISRHKEHYIDDLRDICKEVISGQEGWELIGERENGKLLAFIDTTWKEFCMVHTGTGWQPQTDSLLLLDFDFRVIGEVTLILTISSGSIEDKVRRSLFEKTKGQHPGIFEHRGHRLGTYSANFIRLYESEPILSKSDIIDGDRAALEGRITEWAHNFASSQFPKMSRIVEDAFREIEAELPHN